MNLKKIEVIKNWLILNNFKLTQNFLKFCNFYKCFIYCFFNFTKLFSKLIKKNQFFKWISEYQNFFESFKNVLFKIFVLVHFDSDRKTVLKIDISQYIINDVLFQYNNNNNLYSVAFYSKNILLIKCNYHIYNKELLIIIKCLKNWRFKLEMIYDFFKVLTDNQILKHFKTI